MTFFKKEKYFQYFFTNKTNTKLMNRVSICLNLLERCRMASLHLYSFISFNSLLKNLFFYFRNRLRHHSPCRPTALQIVSAGDGVHVESLAGEVQPWGGFRFQCLGVHRVERHAAASYKFVLELSATRNVLNISRQRVD